MIYIYVLKCVSLLKQHFIWCFFIYIYFSKCIVLSLFFYREYCNANSLKPLSTADFGKVMKQVYPQVRPRRLGTRGNSRYCYAGLKKRLKLEEPSTPECGGGKPLKVCADIEQELNEATSLLIREWAEKLLTVKFSSLRELALYLIDKMFVDHQSSAAHTVLSTMAKSRDGE